MIRLEQIEGVKTESEAKSLINHLTTLIDRLTEQLERLMEKRDLLEAKLTEIRKQNEARAKRQ